MDLLKFSVTRAGIALAVAAATLAGVNSSNAETLVLAAPNKGDSYYARKYKSILKFQVNYAKAISRRDKVVILTDDAGYEYFSKHLPKSMLLRKPVDDIWARDFSPVAHKSNLQFRYTSYAGGGRAAADSTQRSFNTVVGSVGVRPRKTKYILDGGNFVGVGNKVIVTERFLRDNRLSKKEGKTVLKNLLGASKVAIIPSDDPGLAHADGMVMFGDSRTLFVNQYKGAFRKKVMDELQTSFPGVKIVEIPVRFSGGSYDPKFGSACGIYVNAVVTGSTIYMPVFGSSLDSEALNIVRKNTRKAVVPIPSRSVCSMGGSARCLVWQAKGSHGSKLVNAARKD
ncbi:MAG: agmatine deiminase family protein [Pseudomonadota bacterium]